MPVSLIQYVTEWVAEASYKQGQRFSQQAITLLNLVRVASRTIAETVMLHIGGVIHCPLNVLYIS